MYFDEILDVLFILILFSYVVAENIITLFTHMVFSMITIVFVLDVCFVCL